MSYFSKNHFIIIQTQYMCFGQPQQPTTQKAKKYVMIYKFLIPAQLIISILNFISPNFFLREAIFGLFLIILNFIILYNLSFQLIIIKLFLSFFFSIKFLLFFLQPFQNKANFQMLKDYQKYALAQSIICSLYYLMLTIFSFRSYRQFKKIGYSKNPILKQYFPSKQEIKSNQSEQKIIKAQLNNDFQINYGKIEINEKHKNQESGNFAVLKGKGVVIQ